MNTPARRPDPTPAPDPASTATTAQAPHPTQRQGIQADSARPEPVVTPRTTPTPAALVRATLGRGVRFLKQLSDLLRRVGRPAGTPTRQSAPPSADQSQQPPVDQGPARDDPEAEWKKTKLWAPNLMMLAILVGLGIAWVSGATTSKWGVLGPSCSYDNSEILGDLIPPTAKPGGPTAQVIVPPSQPVATFTPSARPNQADRVALASDLRNYYEYASCSSDLNRGLDVATRLTTLSLTFLTTIASALNWKDRGVIFGAIATALVAFQTAFPFADQAQLYTRLAARSGTLMYQARSLVDGDTAAFEKVRDAFSQMKEEAADVTPGTPAPSPTPADGLPPPQASPVASPAAGAGPHTLPIAGRGTDSS